MKPDVMNLKVNCVFSSGCWTTNEEIDLSDTDVIKQSFIIWLLPLWIVSANIRILTQSMNHNGTRKYYSS